jgi:hypothetical protein
MVIVDVSACLVRRPLRVLAHRFFPSPHLGTRLFWCHVVPPSGLIDAHLVVVIEPRNQLERAGLAAISEMWTFGCNAVRSPLAISVAGPPDVAPGRCS